MQIKHLERDPGAIRAVTRVMPDKSVVAVKECKIYIPARFAERGLASIGVETYITGMYAIVHENKYAVMMVCANMRIEPALTNRVSIEGEEYLEFVFPPGCTIVATLDLVRVDTLTYKIFDEIVSKARVPWYFGYRDLAKIFDSAKMHANANIGQNHEVTELLVSLISRNPENLTEYFRQTEGLAPAYVPLKSVAYSATNTINKLGGAYFRDGVISSLVSPADRSENIEITLRQ